MAEDPIRNPEAPQPGQEPSTQTTSIGLPDLAKVSAQDLHLEDDDHAAISALPVGSALLVAHGGPNQGARFLLDRDSTTVGRHPEAEIFLDDVTVSRRHAVFLRSGEGFRVQDTRSLNGTYVNGDRVDELELRNGMELQIGKFRLTYYAGTHQLGQ